MFLLIRHAESTWNAAGRWQGQGDPPLSDRGRRQAAQLAQALGAEPIDFLIASDLARAAETAAILGRALGLVPRADRRLRELDIGAWTGLTGAEIAHGERELLERFQAGDPDARPGGGESRREIRRRVRGAVGEMTAQHPGRRVALVTHLGVIRALLTNAEPANATWCRLSGGDPVLRQPDGVCA
jgi:broad specificity phosphatase PhoE